MVEPRPAPPPNLGFGVRGFKYRGGCVPPTAALGQLCLPPSASVSEKSAEPTQPLCPQLRDLLLATVAAEAGQLLEDPALAVSTLTRLIPSPRSLTRKPA